VAAALRPHLVLEEAAGGPPPDELRDRALDVEGVAVAGVDVDTTGTSTAEQMRAAASSTSVCVRRPKSGCASRVAASE
jgi:hypothetical protein